MDGTLFEMTSQDMSGAAAAAAYDSMKTEFNPSNISSIYGNSSTVQPTALKAYILIKT